MKSTVCSELESIFFRLQSDSNFAKNVDLASWFYLDLNKGIIIPNDVFNQFFNIFWFSTENQSKTVNRQLFTRQSTVKYLFDDCFWSCFRRRFDERRSWTNLLMPFIMLPDQGRGVKSMILCWLLTPTLTMANLSIPLDSSSESDSALCSPDHHPCRKCRYAESQRESRKIIPQYEIMLKRPK